MLSLTMKEKTPFLIIFKDLANKFRGRFVCFGVEADLEGNITDLGYQIVFRASKF